MLLGNVCYSTWCEVELILGLVDLGGLVPPWRPRPSRAASSLQGGLALCGWPKWSMPPPLFKCSIAMFFPVRVAVTARPGMCDIKPLTLPTRAGAYALRGCGGHGPPPLLSQSSLRGLQGTRLSAVNVHQRLNRHCFYQMVCLDFLSLTSSLSFYLSSASGPNLSCKIVVGGWAVFPKVPRSTRALFPAGLLSKASGAQPARDGLKRPEIHQPRPAVCCHVVVGLRTRGP